MGLRAGKICSVLEGTYGVIVKKPKRGSHIKLTRPGCERPFVIPANNGAKTDIPDKYIRSMCRCLGIDEDEFRGLC